jgi:hypothetical protein
MNPTLEPHRLSLLFPDMEKPQYETFKETIKEHGLREDIILLDGQILDGRHRYRACLDVGIKPTFEQYNPAVHGASPAQFVLDRNLERRHLSASQKAAIAVEALPIFEQEAADRKTAAQFKVLPKEDETPQYTDEDGLPETTVKAHTRNKPQPEGPIPAPLEGKKGGKAADLVAERFGTSATMVRLAKRLKKENEDLYQDVLAGRVTVTAAIATIDAAKSNEDKKAKKEKERQERHASLVVLENKYGPTSQVVTAARKGTILKDNAHLALFSELPPEQGKPILPLLAKGWTLPKAQQYLEGKLTTDSTIEDLINSAIASKADEGVPFVRVFGAFTVTVTQ